MGDSREPNTDESNPLLSPPAKEDELDFVENGMKGFQEPKIKSKRTFRLFLAMYLVYVAPALYYMTDELFFGHSSAPQVLPMETNSLSLFLWTATVFTLYGTLRLITKSFGWKRHPKTAADHKEDLLRLARTATALGVIGRVANRVQANDHYLFLILVAYYTWFYTVMFEATKELNITLTPGWIYNIHTVIITLTTSLLIAGVLTLHCIFAAEDQELFEFLAFLAIGLALHVLLLLSPKRTHVHIHHWYWAWALAHICVFDSKTSQFAQAMFCGGYIHGVALFGVERCFYDSAEDDHGDRPNS